MNREDFFIEDNEFQNYREEIIRYLSFWPYYFLILGTLLISSYLYIRYASFKYETSTIIEIFDEAQDSEMALPTELTVFNRSMINLENEINILKSFLLNSKVVKDLNSNVSVYEVGSIKISQKTIQKLYNVDHSIDFKIDTDLIEETLIYELETVDGKILISEFDIQDNLIKNMEFEGLTTKAKNHNFPFDLSISQDVGKTKRIIKIFPVKNTANMFRSIIDVSPIGEDSDQLLIKIVHENKIIAQEYLNGLIKAFDNDGIMDRRLEYKNTIEFVNRREVILKDELGIIELKKQNFKQNNKLSNLSVDAANNIDLKTTYNSQLFDTESQKSLAEYLLLSLSENNFDYLPLNIGIKDFDLNQIVSQHNSIVSERNKYLSETGPNNVIIKSLEAQIQNTKENISNSLESYLKSIDIKIENLKLKDLEFENIYKNVPANEKTLRSIERELSIKEALYLLLLQKREEAAINLAVVKPTIKVIDYPLTNSGPVSPNIKLIYISVLVLSVVLYVGPLYIWFYLDNKIHNKDQLTKRLNQNIPVICEIPFIKDRDALMINSNSSLRSVLSESIRMLVSNLKFTSHNFNESKGCKSLLFTSSIKGEGKTLASVNTALNLSNDLHKDKKVILLGADLRNPQVHKIFGVDKNQKGISEIMYNNDTVNFNKYLTKFENLDVLFSGAIPPNPTSMLSSKSFQELLNILKENYDYIIIDSAPCLLVSDTFQIINYVDSVIYIFRSNFTDIKIIDYINEIFETKKIKNLNIVLNAIGNSASYGYKYGYQYGYRYGYKYAYNYGYGYGYGDDKS